MKPIFSMFLYILEHLYSMFDIEFICILLIFWLLHSFIDWSRGFFR